MDPLELLTRWGPALAFVAVLLEQAGLPVPAAPVLIAAGALAADGTMRPELVLATAFAACLIADHAWFFGGRRLGRGLLAGVCRLSLSPDTCVRRTDDLIARHGTRVLLVAKFIPGVSAVAIPTAAAMGIPYRRFLLFDSLGALLWCAAYVGAGMIFSREINRLLATLDVIGGWALVVLGGLLALYIALKFRHRARLKRLFKVVRITPEEMVGLIESDPDLLVLDARSELARAEDPRRLPRAIEVAQDDALRLLPEGARDRTIVTFCACPNEASAALLADQLIKAGYLRVRVLVGGPAALAMLGAKI